MRIADQWQDFEILDTSSGEKLERWGNTILIRPDPQVIWRPEKGPEWQKADARYNRSSAGGGSWQIYRSHPQFWTIGYRDLKFKISPTGFKHTGLFPEQAVNWDFFREKIEKAGRPIRVLNLFAYTGGATLACAAAGAASGMRSVTRMPGFRRKPALVWVVPSAAAIPSAISAPARERVTSAMAAANTSSRSAQPQTFSRICSGMMQLLLRVKMRLSERDGVRLRETPRPRLLRKRRG